MTAAACPTREQTRDAFEWLASWMTRGDHVGPDQSSDARRILGDRAYWIIVNAADAWYRRNTLTSIGSIMRREEDDGATETVEGDRRAGSPHRGGRGADAADPGDGLGG